MTEDTKETYKGKPIIDIKQRFEEEKEEESVTINETPSMYFTVTVAGKGRPSHMLVKASSALEALIFVQEKKKYFVLAVHVTEYSNYFDTSENIGSKESVPEEKEIE